MRKNTLILKVVSLALVMVLTAGFLPPMQILAADTENNNENLGTSNVATSGITLSDSSIELEVGQTHTLTYSLSQDDAEPFDVEWIASDAEIAAVADGVITAIAEGTAEISVRSLDNNNITAICSIRVIPAVAQIMIANYSSSNKFLAAIDAPAAGSTPISNRFELEAIKNDLSGIYHLTADIDLSGVEWEPIGEAWFTAGNPFTGTFDGQGHIISNLSITQNYSYCGLFGNTSGTIKNVGLENTNIYLSNSSSNSFTGGICGFNTGTLYNCYNTGSIIYDYSDSGGICGRNDGVISNCYNTGLVSSISSGSSHAAAGGICSINTGMVRNCYNVGSVSVSSTGVGVLDVGGICTQNFSSGTIMNCYNTGSLSASGGADAGGICSVYNAGDIVNCYNTGSITASYSYSYGICGGKTSGGMDVGTVSNSYCTDLYNSLHGTQLTSEQMKDASNFVGFDFTNVWDIDPAENDGYPFLRVSDDSGNVGGGTAPTITTTSFDGGTVGTSYSATLTATGDTPITWTLQSGTLPTGLSLSGNSIIGTPTMAGTFNFTVKATNATGNATKALSIVVVGSGSGIAPIITTTSLPSGIVGLNYSTALAAIGDAPITWSIASGTLPAGLNLSTDGTIAGIPTAAGTYEFAVQAMNTVNSYVNLSPAKTLSITISSVMNISSYFEAPTIDSDFSKTVKNNTVITNPQAFINSLLSTVPPSDRANVDSQIKALLFEATYRPNVFGATQISSWRWPNKFTAAGDPIWGNDHADAGLNATNIHWDWSSMGCMAYAHFAKSYISGQRGQIKTPNNNVGYSDISHLTNNAKCGNVITYNRKKGGTHTVLYLAKSQDNTGFYCLSYDGGDNSKAHNIRLCFIEFTHFQSYAKNYWIYQPSGKTTAVTTMNINAKCPIDIIVRYNGEELNSATGVYSASFGTMIVNGFPNDKEIDMQLDYGPDYEFLIYGTDAGHMDITVTFDDGTGNNLRQFQNIGITPTTLISCPNYSAGGDLALYIDHSGNGGMDEIWYATVDGSAANSPSEHMLYEITNSDDGRINADPPTPILPNNPDTSHNGSNNRGSSSYSNDTNPSIIDPLANFLTKIKTAIENAAKEAPIGQPVKATVQVKNATKITLAMLKQAADTAKKSGGNVTLHFDTMSADGKTVLTRIYVNSELATKDIQLSMNETRAKNVKSLFEKYFKNKVSVVSFDQQDSWGMPVDIATKIDLTGMDTKNLYFYSYDKETNCYQRVKNPDYWIDQNGYLHFTTPYAGDIIISENSLEKR